MTPVFPREGAAVPFFFVCAGMRRTGGTGVSAHGAETGDAPPHFLFEISKRKCAVHGGKEKMSGPKSFPAVRFGQTGGERAGASVNDSLLPGAPGSLGTERVLPRSWGRGCGFRGYSMKGMSFWPRAFRFATRYQEAAGRPIRDRQSGSGGKTQVKSVLHPPTHDGSPSREEGRKFQQDRTRA